MSTTDFEESPLTMSLHGMHRHDPANTPIPAANAARNAAQDRASAAATRPVAVPPADARTRTATIVVDADDARALAVACAAVAHTPEIREQKVAEIKQRVASGTYAVPARGLARTMLACASAPSSTH